MLWCIVILWPFPWSHRNRKWPTGGRKCGGSNQPDLFIKTRSLSITEGLPPALLFLHPSTFFQPPFLLSLSRCRYIIFSTDFQFSSEEIVYLDFLWKSPGQVFIFQTLIQALVTRMKNGKGGKGEGKEKERKGKERRKKQKRIPPKERFGADML